MTKSIRQVIIKRSELGNRILKIENKAKQKKQKNFRSRLYNKNGKVLFKLRVKSDNK